VKVLSEADYAAWVQKKKAEAAPATAKSDAAAATQVAQAPASEKK